MAAFTRCTRSRAAAMRPVATLPSPTSSRPKQLEILFFVSPTPTFGAGLIEAISDSTIMANIKNPPVMGIIGRENREGNAGTVTRFGWKAQNKSLVIFSGEAYNVEQGVTNELFSQERDEEPRRVCSTRFRKTT